VHDEPLRCKEPQRFLLTQELTPFELVDEILEEGKSVILFDSSLRGEEAHGLNVVAYQPDGLVVELLSSSVPLPRCSSSRR
jgi:hypothetical protein